LQSPSYGKCVAIYICFKLFDFLAQLIFATFLAAALNRTVLHPDLAQDELAKRLNTYVLSGLK
jgi:hypothetical protein